MKLYVISLNSAFLSVFFFRSGVKLQILVSRCRPNFCQETSCGICFGSRYAYVLFDKDPAQWRPPGHLRTKSAK